MRVKLFTCALSSSLDARSNSISIFHLLEEIAAPAYPIVVQRISIVGLLFLDDNEPRPEIELRIFLGDQQLFVGPFQANFEVQRTARAVAEFNGLVVPAPGIVRTALSMEGRDFANWEVVCRQIAPPQLEMRLQPGGQQEPVQDQH
jgi:hypothetical protein